MTPRILIVGAGVVGKRLARAVGAQPDMQLEGVAIRSPAAAERLGGHCKTYAVDASAMRDLHRAGYSATRMEDAIASATVILDCTAEGVATGLSRLYSAAGTPFIMQGGEPAAFTEVQAYSTDANYRRALGASSLRVVSCNVTAQSRIIAALAMVAEIEQAQFVVVKRGADPGRRTVLQLDALTPALNSTTHHADDLSLLFPSISFHTSEIRSTSTLMHVNAASVRLRSGSVTEADVLVALAAHPRIVTVKGKTSGLASTADLRERARDVGRDRGDIPEVVVWTETVGVQNGVVTCTFAVHMESIVIPETIDAIRAMCRLQRSGEEAVAATDLNLAGLYGQPLAFGSA